LGPRKTEVDILAKLDTTLLALCVAVSLAAAGAAGAQTLRDSAPEVVRGNPRVDFVAFNRQAVEQELSRARSQYLPQHDLRASSGPEWFDNGTTRARGGSASLPRRETGAFVTQRLFDGWETDSAVERQKARGQSAARRVGETSEVVTLDAVEAYIDVLRQRRLVRLAEQNLEIHRQIVGRISQRVGRGAAPAADQEQARARHDNAQATLVETQGALEDTENRYLIVVNSRAGELATAEFPQSAMRDVRTLDAAIDRSRAGNRSLKITVVDIAVAENEIGAAAAYPKLNLELGATRDRNIDGTRGDSNDASSLVVMRWNLYRGGSNEAQRRVALGRMSQATAQRHATARSTEEEARRSWVQYQRASERIPPLTGAVDKSRRVRDAYTDQFFNQGQRSLIDVLNAENELFVSRGRLVSAESSRVFSACRLLAAIGELVTFLHLEMPPEADEGRGAKVPVDPRPGPRDALTRSRGS